MIKINPSDKLISVLRNKYPSNRTEAGAAVTAGLKHAIKNGLSPNLCESDFVSKGQFKTFRINPVIKAKLNSILIELKKQDDSATLASTTMAMLCAAARDCEKSKDPKKKSAANPHQDWLLKAGLSKRDEQLELIRSSEYLLSNNPNPVVMAEGSVGVGKSYAIACSAISELLRNGKSKPVLVAAPTYQVAKQLLGSTNHLINSNDMKGFSTDLIRSKSEFISHDLMSNLLTSDDIDIEKTTIELAQSLLDDENYDRSQYEEIGIDCSGLLLSLANNPQDKAEDAYFVSRCRSTNSNIIFCTHAMLAFHVFTTRMRVLRGVKDTHDFESYLDSNKFIEAALSESDDLEGENAQIPKLGLLIIDEAHKLEESYRSVFNRRISIESLKRSISGSVSEKLISKKDSIETLSAIDAFQSQLSTMINGSYPRKYTTEFYQNLSASINWKKKKILTKNGIFLQECLDSIQFLSASRDSDNSFYLSPVRQALSIQSIGYRPLSILDMTWRMSPKSLLVSGTLASGNNKESYSMMANKLAVPTDRLKCVSPIESKWLRDNVTIHLPELKNTQDESMKSFCNTAFYPPKTNESGLIKKWGKKQADYITEHSATLKGGCIVFCTSYEQIEMLYSLLEKNLSNFEDVLLLKSVSGLSMSSTINKYKKAYAGALRPIWIAISTVGTGVDITDDSVPAIHDQLVQAIFITRIPFPHTTNSKKTAFISSLRDSLILSKQTLGRLVRRPGRKDMHIHLMDSRFNIKKGYYRMFLELTEYYKGINILHPK